MMGNQISNNIPINYQQTNRLNNSYSNINDNNTTNNNSNLNNNANRINTDDVINLIDMTIDDSIVNDDNNIEINRISTQQYVDEYTYLINQIKTLEDIKLNKIEQQFILTTEYVEQHEIIKNKINQLDIDNQNELQKYESLITNELNNKLHFIQNNMNKEFEEKIIFNSTIWYNEHYNMSLEDLISNNNELIEKQWRDREILIKNELNHLLIESLSVANEEYNIQYEKLFKQLNEEYEQNQNKNNKRSSNIFTLFSNITNSSKKLKQVDTSSSQFEDVASASSDEED